MIYEHQQPRDHFFHRTDNNILCVLHNPWVVISEYVLNLGSSETLDEIHKKERKQMISRHDSNIV